MTNPMSEALRLRAAKLGYPVVDLEQVQVPSSVLDLVPEWLAAQNSVLPLALEGEVLRLAAAAPPTPELLDRLRHLLKRPVAMALTEDDVSAAIQRCYAAAASKSEGMRPKPREEEAIDFTEVGPVEDLTTVGEEVLDPDDSRVVQVVQAIIAEALAFGASRILIFPMRRHLKVAYRIGEVLCPRDDLPGRLHYPVLAKLMTMANLHGMIKVVSRRREQRLHAVFAQARHGLSAALEVTADPTLVEASRAKAGKLGYRFVTLDDCQTPPADVLALASAATAREEAVLPLALEGPALLIAMAHPPTPETLDRLGFLFNRPLSVALAAEGALRAAIERYYGPSDPDALDPELWGGADAGAQEQCEGAAADGRLPALSDAPSHQAAQPLVEHLRAVYQPRMFELFEELAGGGRLCEQNPATGDPYVVLPHAHVVARMPVAARQCLEDKIWALRGAIVSRLEHFLDKDSLARAMAMTYSQYLAACELAQGRNVSINPATRRDTWINFAYALAIRSFPAIESNGALLSFLAEHSDQLSARIAAILDDPALTRDPATARAWLARLAGQTTTGEAIDFDSPPIVHLLELLISEAMHVRASGIAIVPLENRVEVAYRVQNAAYARDELPLGRLYPLLARLRWLADARGRLRISVGKRERRLRVRLLPTEHGLAAAVDLLADVSAAETCKAQAAQAGYPFVSLEDVAVPGMLLGLVPKDVAWKKTVLPLEVCENVLTVVVAVPPTSRRLDELRLIFNNSLSLAMAPEDEVLAAIYRHYHPAAAEAPPSAAAVALLGLSPARVMPNA